MVVTAKSLFQYEGAVSVSATRYAECGVIKTANTEIRKYGIRSKCCAFCCKNSPFAGCFALSLVLNPKGLLHDYVAVTSRSVAKSMKTLFST